MAKQQSSTEPADIRDAQILLITATNRLLDAADEVKQERDRLFRLLRAPAGTPDAAEESSHA